MANPYAEPTRPDDVKIGEGPGSIRVSDIWGVNQFNLSTFIEAKKGSLDWMPVFEKAFDSLAQIGGGTLTLPVGMTSIYSRLTIPSNVLLKGLGRGISKIKLGSGVDSEIISLDTHSNCGLSDLTIIGNMNDPAKANDKAGLVIGRPGLLNDGSGNMENVLISNIGIQDVSGNGLHCHKYTWVYELDQVRIQWCAGYGAFIDTTDNMFSRFYINGNQKRGLQVPGHSNKFTEMKVIFNGRGTDWKGSQGTDYDNAGIYISGNRNILTSVEAQENYGHGFVIENGIDNQLVGCVSDANGYSMISNSRPDGTAYGFYSINSQRTSGIVTGASFKTTLSQKAGYYIDASSIDFSPIYGEDRPYPNVNLSKSSAPISMKAFGSWESFVPTLTWNTATPTIQGATYRRKIMGKTVHFQIRIIITDGKGTDGLRIQLPADMTPAPNNMFTPYYNYVVIGSTTYTDKIVNLRDNPAYNDFLFGHLGTLTNGQTADIRFNGSYELA